MTSSGLAWHPTLCDVVFICAVSLGNLGIGDDDDDDFVCVCVVSVR